MAKYGLTVRYYPTDIISDQECIAIEVTEWRAKTPTMQHENLVADINVVGDSEINPNDPDFVILVLNEALRIVEQKKAVRDTGFISGANGSGDLASEKASPKM